ARIDWGEVDDPQERARLEAFSGARGFDGWLRAMEAHGASVNMGSFVGATTIRVYAKGEAMGPPTPAELDTMRAVTRRAMEDGAFGFATALIYPPGNFATTEELVEMARTMAPYGGIYITHMRSEADRLLEAMDEAMRIGDEGGVPVEIYHLKAAGRRNWHKAALAVEKIDSARAAGLDVQANMYPYVAGGTGLSACLPPWASADGELLENLRDPETRRRIREEVLNPSGDWEDLCGQATPEGVLLMGLEKPENRKWAGMRLGEVAEEMGKDWVATLIDLLISEEQRIGTIYFLMSEENVALQIRQPWIKFGTDAGGVDPVRADEVGLVHPRSYGTFPRILGRYVREEEVIPLEDAVRKATSAVATRLSLEDRGLLKEGFYADVVVFDPAAIVDRATFQEPHRLSTGVRHVIVNGTPVLRDGEHTGALPGRILRGPGYRPER
ncbi:MAG: amidohydrolase family protein, partial [Gemmatimonadetes bacterium]|nr:amidohydrolase family protein [Gemmatimonadota bacterium]NIR79414.1 amidohydrolase family protein [Gemmatimonadota bacterium]NIT88088.1 amidohydrolase family protein [Gemmatimonadota bacterium]NIU31918.1 amidohydrolase family protein [Gemmatimonadota bacterium]NIU36529.1 amidohydrolase family protein [Gemmatimonadota bacterium]